jgi:glycosyltransferase involved in cell wall biosynthesis
MESPTPAMSSRPAPPTISVIVSSYNYEDHVVAAVNSVVAQAYRPLEIIVVDDGSSDRSMERLQQAFSGNPEVRLIQKTNGGQLSAWLEGLQHASGDVIALLDSDDLWHPCYLQRVVEVYANNPRVDYVYTNMELFGSGSGLMLSKRRHRQSRDLGLSILMGAFVQRWQGVATSGNTLRRTLMQQILALPTSFIAEWRSRPDDCLFYGADILGGHKYYVAEPLARHREHSRNALREFSNSALSQARYAVRLERLLGHYRQAAGITDYWLRLAKHEFRSKPKPTLSECWIYCGLAFRAPYRLSSRISQVGSILKHYISTR